MSEEHDFDLFEDEGEGEPETIQLDTKIKVEAIDAETIREAENLRLTVEGHHAVVSTIAQLVYGYFQVVGAETVSATDGDGNDLLPSLLPARLGLLDTGDTPVEE